MKKDNKTKSPADMRLLIQKFSVPIMFIIICAICIPLSGLSANMLINEIVTRMGRNAFLILSLLIPIMAGMGLNFGMTLGAMAAEIGAGGDRVHSDLCTARNLLRKDPQ